LVFTLVLWFVGLLKPSCCKISGLGVDQRKNRLLLIDPCRRDRAAPRDQRAHERIISRRVPGENRLVMGNPIAEDASREISGQLSHGYGINEPVVYALMLGQT